jgi:hypothetical protein
MLPHLPAHVLGDDDERLRPASGPGGSRADGRIERDVAVLAPGETGTGVFPAAEGDERPVAPPDRSPLEPIGRHGAVEHALGVDLELGDTGTTLELF